VLVLAPGVSLADTPTSIFGAPCPTYQTERPGQPAENQDMRICSAEVPSYDGTQLDVDLTLPARNTMTPGSRHPLIVMLHGFGNNKREWESTNDKGEDPDSSDENAEEGADKYRWNSHWFQKHGYYVLTYTARGFRNENPPEGYQPPTPASAPWSEGGQLRGTIHLKSREIEVKDTQWLAALAADASRADDDAFPDIDPNQIAVTGGSYGGGESWLQASQRTWSFPYDCSRDVSACELPPGVSGPDVSDLPKVQLQAAIPKYPWTDLAYSLAPNGHGGGPSGSDIYESAQGNPSPAERSAGTPHDNPFGVPKFSFTEGLFALGNERGRFEEGSAPGPEEGSYSTNLWHERGFLGDPYDPAAPPGDPIIAQLRRGLTKFRGPYYQDEGWAEQCGPNFDFAKPESCDPSERKVAVFSISGWTDDLFPPIESFRMFKYLKRLDPRWPVEVALADVGHSRAQNKPETWHRLNAQAFQWLESHIDGSHEEQTTVSSEPTVCDETASARRLTAGTPEELANGTLSVHYPGGATANPLGAADLNGTATDAIAGPLVQPGERCRHSNGPAGGGYTAYSLPLTETRTFVGLGSVTVPYVFAGAASATLNARLFDVAPDGSELLMTRGTYRLENPGPDPDPPTGVLELPFYGNHWRLQPGHQIRLDLTQVDFPTYHPSHLPSSIAFTQGVTLTLPTREAGGHILGAE
jgi:dienelactone hydrolase